MSVHALKKEYLIGFNLMKKGGGGGGRKRVYDRY